MQIGKALVAAAICLAALGAGAAIGQTTAPASAPTSQPAAPPILGQIPAGAMGYVAVENIAASTAEVDKFLEGLSDPLPAKGLAATGGALTALRSQARLGEGFNPNGGFAVVMLDLQQFGLNAKALGEGLELANMPVVLMVPGSSIDAVFSNYKRTQPKGAHHVRVALRMGPMFAAYANGYVLLSPLEEALDAVAEARQKAQGELSADELAMIRESPVAVHLNMKVAAPFFNQMIKDAEQKIAGEAPAPGHVSTPLDQFTGAIVLQVLPMCREVLGQMESVTLALRFTELGALVDSRLTFAKDSVVGKAVAACRPIDPAAMARLPNFNCVAAVVSSAGGEAGTRLATDMADKILVSPAMADLPEATRSRIKKLFTDWGQQIQGVHFVMGAAPKGGGLLGVTMVLDCKDSQQVKGLLTEGADLAAEVVGKKSAASAPASGPAGQAPGATAATAPAAAFKAHYAKAVATSSSVAVDAIVVSADKTVQTDEAEMNRVLGERQVRLLVAAPNATTVVVTLGGGMEMMNAAIKTAQDRGGNLLGPDVQKRLAQLPKNPCALGLCDFDSAVNFARLMAKEPPPSGAASQMSTKPPVVFNVTAQDSVLRCAALIPDDVFMQIIQFIITGRTHAASEPSDEGEESPSPAKPKSRGDI